MTLYQRVIPCLLLSNSSFVKTTNFADPKYLGDPINIIKIFNELEVDEAIILDIEASRQKLSPNFDLIAKIAGECRMPLCYGGGITSAEQVDRIISLGVEKVSFNSLTFSNPKIIKEAVQRVGSQSIVVVADVLKDVSSTNYKIICSEDNKWSEKPIKEYAKKIQSLGAGEFVINCIHKDGTLEGYDFDVLDQVYNEIDIPITLLGGAQNLENIKLLGKKFPGVGAGVGTLFVLKGKYRAVLINYPKWEERNSDEINSNNNDYRTVF